MGRRADVPWWEAVPAPAATDSSAPDLVAGRTIYTRKEVAWASVRSWRSETKRTDLDAFKAAKSSLDAEIIAEAAGDICHLLRRLFGPPPHWTVSTVAVGHSRRPDSFAVRLAQAVAADLGLPFMKMFADRFVSGSSHPKQFVQLLPLQFCGDVTSPILLVDDVATSGWHLEEALTALRALGVSAFGVAWISGTVK